MTPRNSLRPDFSLAVWRLGGSIRFAKRCDKRWAVPSGYTVSMDLEPQSILAPADALPDSNSAAVSAESRGRVYVLRGLIWLLIAAVLAFSFREGIHLRRWVFETTDPIRYLDDIYRGCYWGLCASGPEG